MPLDFPTSPSVNDTYSFGGKTWIWTGEYWGLSSTGAINDIAIGNITPSTGAFTALAANTGVFSGDVTANSFIGDGSQLTGISTGNVDLSAVAQDIIPAANITYDLGNTTNRWRDIYLANSTIYLGEATIQANATSLIMTNPDGGNFVLSGVLTEIGADSGDFSGNVTANYFIGDGSQLTGIAASGNSISDGTSEVRVISTNGNIRSNVNGTTIQTISSQGVAVTGNVSGGNLNTTGAVVVSGTGAATSTTTGSIRTAGGAGVAGNIYVGGAAVVTGNVSANFFIGNGSQLSGISTPGYAVSVISANTAAQPNILYVLTNTLTLTLPGSPAAGAAVAVSNRSDQTDCIIARNGRKIMGADEDLVINVLNAAFELVYADTNQGWVLL